MIILGIDPGYDRLGIAVIKKDPKGKDCLVYSDCLQTSSKDDIYTRLKQVGEKVYEIINKFNPDLLAIETLFITKNQKTAMRVSEVRGIIIYEALKNNLGVFEYSPMQIKTAITGSGSSDKNMMEKMVNIILDIPAKRCMRDDEYDAIAVALTCSACYKKLPRK